MRGPIRMPITLPVSIFLVLLLVIGTVFFISGETEAPLSNFEYSTSFPVVGEVVNFSNTSITDGFIMSSHWQIEYGGSVVESSYQRNIVYTFPFTGEFKVTLTVWNDRNVSNSVSKFIIVSDVESDGAEFSLLLRGVGWTFNRDHNDLPESTLRVEYKITSDVDVYDITLYYENFNYEIRKWQRQGEKKYAQLRAGSSLLDSFIFTYEWFHEWDSEEETNWLPPPEHDFRILLHYQGEDVEMKSGRALLGGNLPESYWITPQDPKVIEATNVALRVYSDERVWRRIWNYVYPNNEYFTYKPEEQGHLAFPREALEICGGVCWEQAVTTVSMLRAAGYESDDVFVRLTHGHAGVVVRDEGWSVEQGISYGWYFISYRSGPAIYFNDVYELDNLPSGVWY